MPDVVDKSGVVPPSAVPQYQRDIYGTVKDRGPGPHVLTGPIEIKGAEPGDVLEVRILDVSLAIDWGYNRQRPYTGALPDEFTAIWTRIIPIDRQKKTAEVAKGVVVPVDRPFFGTMGVAPDPSMGRISSGPPGVHTGNMDNKDLIAGTTLFMPVFAPGAMFSAGDAHAAQGHGEVDLTAIETALRGNFQFIVRKDMKLTWPRAETPTHWIVMGLHPNLEEAMKIAVRETIDFITKRFPHLTREEAYMIASVAVDYHVTQVVDGTKGIHGMIPKSIFTARRSRSVCIADALILRRARSAVSKDGGGHRTCGHASRPRRARCAAPQHEAAAYDSQPVNPRRRGAEHLALLVGGQVRDAAR